MRRVLARALAALLLAAGLSLGAAAPALAYVETDVMTMAGHGWIQPSYLVVHSTANPGATARNHVDYWNRMGNGSTMAHWIIDWTGACYQMAPSDAMVYHVGYGNRYSVGIEICEATNPQDFAEGFDEAARWCADFLASRGWGVDRMVSHDEARWLWGGTDHTDPVPYFSRWGESWAGFKARVASYLSGSDPEPVAPQESPSLGQLDWWGPLYTSAIQEQLGCAIVDGVVSFQPRAVEGYALNVESWQFGGSAGSNVIRELQRRLAARGYYAGELDGWCGPATYEALQRWLVDSGYDVGPWGCNGYGGPDTNTAVGKAILAGAFRNL